MLWFVTIAGVVGAAVMLGIGLYQDNAVGTPLRKVAKDVLEAGKDTVAQQADAVAKTVAADSDSAAKTLEAQSKAVDTLGSALEGMAKFAEALKGLDAATRDYLISVVFLLVAVVAASVGKVSG